MVEVWGLNIYIYIFLYGLVFPLTNFGTTASSVATAIVGGNYCFCKDRKIIERSILFYVELLN
jgi:hypothetical protein